MPRSMRLQGAAKSWPISESSHTQPLTLVCDLTPGLLGATTWLAGLVTVFDRHWCIGDD